MSELIQKNDNRATIRWKLLTGASALALTAFVSSNSMLWAEDSGQPAVWIEMGVSTDKVHDSTDSFALPIGSLIPPGGITGPLEDGLNLSRSIGEDGKITFQPHDTNWVFAASVTFGRSRGRGGIHQQAQIPTTSFATFHTTIPTYPFPYHRTFTKPVKKNASSLDGNTLSAETHTILDFSAGKDVGLGMFGRGGTSVFSAGVRFANFTSKLTMPQLQGVVDLGFTYKTRTIPTIAPFPSGARIVPWYFITGGQVWHHVNASGLGAHDFIGVGPSLHWDASMPLVGNESHGGEFLLDWGANAALLFGKQKNKVTHKSTSTYNCYSAGPVHYRQHSEACGNSVVQYAPQSGEVRSTKTVTVPNLGGFAGVSYRLRDFKASFGYRVDYFYRAIGTGIAGQRAGTRSFQGPYVNVSFGIGD